MKVLEGLIDSHFELLINLHFLCLKRRELLLNIFGITTPAVLPKLREKAHHDGVHERHSSTVNSHFLQECFKLFQIDVFTFEKFREKRVERVLELRLSEH